MYYTQDTSKIADAKEAVDDAKREIEIANIQKEIDLLEDQKDLLNEQIDLLDERADKINEYYDEQIKQTEAFYDAQIKSLEKQRKETEAYFESLTKSLETQKFKFQELTELLEKAELSAKLKQLGIDEEALLNGSEEEFEKLKNAYMNIVFQLNEGNDEVLNSLRELSGYDGTAPDVLSESNSELDAMNGKLDESSTSISNVNTSLGETAYTTSNVASNVSDLTSSLTEANNLITDEQTSFASLKQAIDEVIEAINLKTQAIKEEQIVAGVATTTEIAYFVLLKEKILEVKESIGEINDTIVTLDSQPVDNLTNAFQSLYDQILLVSATLGAGMEGQSEGAVGSIKTAIQSFNDISLDEGIIAQFTNLKTAIDSVTSAISGGGGESSGVEGQSGGSAKGGESGGSSSKGSEGGNSLTGAITEMGETVNEVIGEPDAEGDGTVIGEFGSMKTAVNDVTSAIGSGESEGEGSGDGESDNLIGSIVNLGDTTQEEMGEPDGDGIIGKFNEFKGVIEEAANQVKSISEGLDEIDGKEVECTITVNVQMNGSIPAFASGTVLGNMQIESATYNAQYGKAFASGTIGLKHDEKNALRSEYGQPELTVYPNGTTELTTSPVMSDLPKGTVIYNEEETKKIMGNKANSVGNAHANGTTDISFEPYDPDKDDSDFSKFYKAWNAYYGNIDQNVEEISKTLSQHLVMEHNQKMNEEVNRFVNNSSVVNNNRNVQQPVAIQIGDINLTGVQDVNGLAQAIKTRFPNAMLQEIHRR